MTAAEINEFSVIPNHWIQRYSYSRPGLSRAKARLSSLANQLLDLFSGANCAIFVGGRKGGFLKSSDEPRFLSFTDNDFNETAIHAKFRSSHLASS